MLVERAEDGVLQRRDHVTLIIPGWPPVMRYQHFGLEYHAIFLWPGSGSIIELAEQGAPTRAGRAARSWF